MKSRHIAFLILILWGVSIYAQKSPKEILQNAIIRDATLNYSYEKAPKKMTDTYALSNKDATRMVLYGMSLTRRELRSIAGLFGHLMLKTFIIPMGTLICGLVNLRHTEL